MSLYRQKLYSTNIKKNYLNNNFSTEKDKTTSSSNLTMSLWHIFKNKLIFFCLFVVKFNHFFISIFLVLNLYNKIKT